MYPQLYGQAVAIYNSRRLKSAKSSGAARAAAAVHCDRESHDRRVIWPVNDSASREGEEEVLI